jgi:hypothetical protein
MRGRAMERIVERRTNSCENSLVTRASVVTNKASTLLFSPRMQAASRSSLNPAGAGGLLLAVLLAGIGIGLLIGWGAGAAAIGALAGAVVGILGGIAAVYVRYRDSF